MYNELLIIISIIIFPNMFVVLNFANYQIKEANLNTIKHVCYAFVPGLLSGVIN